MSIGEGDLKYQFKISSVKISTSYYMLIYQSGTFLIVLYSMFHHGTLLKFIISI